MSFLTLCAVVIGTIVPWRLDVKEMVQRLEFHYRGSETLQAEFLERYSEGRRSVHVESGKVFFRRPGKMRWEYETPEEKLFVADGKFVWFYVPSDRTVTRARAKDSTDWRTPLALLTGQAKLSRLCQRIVVVPRSPGLPSGHEVLRCTPHGEKRPDTFHPNNMSDSGEPSEANFEEVLLELDAGTGELASVLVRQPGGIELEYRFANWKRDPKLPEALFHFQAPVGVAIVDDVLRNGTEAKPPH